MAHSNLKLKTSLTGSRTSHLDAHSFMEHAQPSYAQITVPNITHSQSSWSQSFYAQILHQFSLFKQIARTAPKSDPKYITWDVLLTYLT
jgi:hypothetical protein